MLGIAREEIGSGAGSDLELNWVHIVAVVVVGRLRIDPFTGIQPSHEKIGAARREIESYEFCR